MPKVTVWRCDKCGKQVEQSDKPDGWASAEVQAPRNKWAHSDDEQSFLWCRTCWTSISEKTPEPEVNHG